MPSSEPEDTSVFLSHSHADKAFARRLAADLQSAGARVWIDEAEINIGDSLFERIRHGINNMDYLAVILSPDSAQSEWVRREVDVAMNQEVEGKRVKVLPLLYKECNLPDFLKGKKYGDFTNPDLYGSSLVEVLRQLGLKSTIVRKKYNSYPFIDGPTRFRDLTDDAKFLLHRGTEDNGCVIETTWLEKELPGCLVKLKTSRWQIDTSDSSQEASRWQAALLTLEEHYLIQCVASRPGYKAYKITPDGWDLVKFGVPRT